MPMMLKVSVLVLLMSVSSGCKVIENDSLSGEHVAGTYVHTYKADVLEVETGEVMGTRTVRDTIFIKKAGEKFEVSNRKWMDNDYDNEGWILPESKADQAMPTYFVKYDSVKRKLMPDPGEKKRIPLYVDGDRLYWGEAKALEYLRIDDDR
jgi:hypothetical protein